MADSPSRIRMRNWWTPAFVTSDNLGEELQQIYRDDGRLFGLAAGRSSSDSSKSPRVTSTGKEGAG